MNYKELLGRIVQLLGAPKKAWVEIAVESPRKDVMATFVYPLIGLAGLAVLLGALFRDGMTRLVFQRALVDTCSYCVSLFGGFFLASYLVDLLRQYYLKQKANMPISYLFTGYSMVVVFVISIVLGLLPQLYLFKWILQLYVLYIVWEGSTVLFQVNEEKHLWFTIGASFMVIFTPSFIQMLFSQLSRILG